MRCFCNDPSFSTFLTSSYLFYFDKLFMKHLQLMHIAQNYFCQASSVTCPWDMTCSKMRRSINPHFSRTMQIMTNSIILHYVLHANLTNSKESGGLAVLLRGMLSDWMIGKQHLPSPSHNSSCGHHCPTSARQLLLLCNFHTRINFTSAELSDKKLHITNQGSSQVQKINGTS